MPRRRRNSARSKRKRAASRSRKPSKRRATYRSSKIPTNEKHKYTVICKGHFVPSNQHLLVNCFPEPKDIGVQRMLATLWHCIPEGVLRAEYISDHEFWGAPSYSQFIANTNIPDDNINNFISTMYDIVEQWKSNVIEETKCTPHSVVVGTFELFLNEKGMCVPGPR